MPEYVSLEEMQQAVREAEAKAEQAAAREGVGDPEVYKQRLAQRALASSVWTKWKNL